MVQTNLIRSGSYLNTGKTFGEMLRFLRHRSQLTQAELGIALGYSAAMVTRLENGERMPDVALVKLLYPEALGIAHDPVLVAQLIELAAIAREGDRQSNLLQVEVAPVPVNNLPRQLTKFIGRRKELSQVIRLLGENQLVTLTGAGGVGKTRLALEVAHSVLLEYPDGVRLIELASVHDAAMVPYTAAQVFNLAEMSHNGLFDALSSFLQNKHVLLVLDNCEHLVGACSKFVEDLLLTCPYMHVLVTSREALNVPGEVTWRVPPLCASEASSLFQCRVQAIRQDSEAAVEPQAVVQDICRRLDGIPLAIELAAARVQVLLVEQIAERLTDRFHLLTDGARTALPRHRTLRATIDWSYALLAEPERILFQRLAVFVGGWTLDAAEAVCGDQEMALGNRMLQASPTIPSSDILDLLASLVGKSLVVTENTGGSMRYRLLDTLREYAGDRLREANQIDVLRDRHLAYYVMFAEQADVDMARLPVRAWITLLETESGSMNATLSYCKVNAEDPSYAEAGLRIAVSLGLFWKFHRYDPVILMWLQASIAWSHTIQQVSGQAMALQSRSLFLLWALPLSFTDHWKKPEALDKVAEDCLAQCRMTGDMLSAGYILYAQKELALSINDYQRAKEKVLEGLSVFETLHDTRGVWLAIFSIGSIFNMLNEHQELYTLLERTTNYLRELGDNKYYGDLQYMQAMLMLRLGKPDQAAVLFELLMNWADECDSVLDSWSILNLLTIADQPRALRCAEAYLARRRQLGDQETIVVALQQLGRILIDGGDYVRARTILDECVALWRTLGPVQLWVGMDRALYTRAIATRFEGDYRQAIADLDECDRLAKEAGNAWLHAYSLWQRGYVKLSIGDIEAAKGHFKESLRQFEKRGASKDYHPLLFAAIGQTLSMQARGMTQRAMRLAGAAAAFEYETRLNSAHEQYLYNEFMADARLCIEAQTGHADPALVAAWDEGQAMALNKAVAYALDSESFGT